jgi:hypothetical protein
LEQVDILVVKRELTALGLHPLSASELSVHLTCNLPLHLHSFFLFAGKDLEHGTAALRGSALEPARPGPQLQ